MTTLSTPAFFGVVAVLVLAAHLGGALAARARLPSVVGELAAGVLLAALPIPFLRSLRADALVEAIAELGVMLLMFDIGLELKTTDLRRIGAGAFRVAAIGVVASVVLVGLASAALGATTSARGHLFVGATLAATSMGISGRVLRELGETKSPEGRTVLAAAVLDDVIGLVLLAVVSALVHDNDGAKGPAIGVVVVRALGFLAGGIAFGRLVLPRLFALARPLAGESALLVFGLAAALGYGFVASLAGLAPIIGAFTAGLVIQPEDYRALARRPGEALEEQLAPLLAFFVPIFFVLAGLKVEVSAFLEARVWAVSALFVAAAAIGKLAAGLGAGRGVSRAAVGVSMIPRGEVSLIFATAGVGLVDGAGPLVSKTTFNAIVVTVVATALLPSLALPRLFARRGPLAADSRRG